jgi:hypothetical protein
MIPRILQQSSVWKPGYGHVLQHPDAQSRDSGFHLSPPLEPDQCLYHLNVHELRCECAFSDGAVNFIRMRGPEQELNDRRCVNDGGLRPRVAADGPVLLEPP